MESSEINKYHNKDIIDRLELLELKWEGIPDIQMYIDFIVKYNEIKNLLSCYLRKDINDTVLSVITFQQMPIIPDTSGNDEDIIKKKYIDNILKDYVNKTENQILNNDFTFKGVTTFHNSSYFESDTIFDKSLIVNESSYFKNYPCINGSLIAPTRDEELVNKKYIDDQIKEHAPDDVARQTQYNSFTNSNSFKGITRFLNEAIITSRYSYGDSGRLLQLAEIGPSGEYKFPEPTTYESAQLVFSDYINEYYFRKNAFLINSNETQVIQSPSLFKTYPCVPKDLPDPTEDNELVTKKYADTHDLPTDVARTSRINRFEDVNIFGYITRFYHDVVISSIPLQPSQYNVGRLFQSAEISIDFEYMFPTPVTWEEDGFVYSDYINEYYYNQHTLIKDSDIKQSVSSIVDFTNGILIKDKAIEVLTSDEKKLLNILKEMLGTENQLRFKNNILADISPTRYLYTSNHSNFSYCNTSPPHPYIDGISSSVLGGLYRMFDNPHYEFLGVLQEVKDDHDNDIFKDTVHLMTYSKTNDRSTPPMYNNGVGMWISGVECNGLWNRTSERLNSVETVLGCVKPEQYDLATHDDILNIQPVFSKVTCDTTTTYESGLLFGKGYLWNNDVINKDIEVTKYALYSKGKTLHPQKTLANSDFNAIFGHLEWKADIAQKYICYEASSFYQTEEDIDLDADQNFNIISYNGRIKWESPSYTADYNKELSLEGSHSTNKYNFTHGLYNEQINTNYSNLKIYKSLNEYDLSILERDTHINWWPIKIIGFGSSITLEHTDSKLTGNFRGLLNDKIGYYGGMYNDELAEYSRCLIQSSFSEYHNCNNLYQNTLYDKIELGSYSSVLTSPVIQYFNVLENTLNTTQSFTKEKHLLTRDAISGYITEYKASSDYPLFATIRWNGYPYSAYSHQSSPTEIYGLYFNNYTTDTTDDSEIASMSTFYNYDPLMEYGTRLEYQYKQKKYIFSLFPDPSIHNTPIINAEIYSTPSALNGSRIELNARTVIAPNISTDIEDLRDESIVNGKIIKSINNDVSICKESITTISNSVAKHEDSIDDLKGTVVGQRVDIVSIFNELSQCPHLSTFVKPYPTPLRGSLGVWNDDDSKADISIHSYNWSPGGAASTGSIATFIVRAQGGAGASSAYVDMNITDITSPAKYTASLRLSSTVDYYSDVKGYLQFFDCGGTSHLIASGNSLDAIILDDRTEKTDELPKPFLVKEQYGSAFKYRLEFRDSTGTAVAYIDLN